MDPQDVPQIRVQENRVLLAMGTVGSAASRFPCKVRLLLGQPHGMGVLVGLTCLSVVSKEGTAQVGRVAAIFWKVIRR